MYEIAIIELPMFQFMDNLKQMLTLLLLSKAVLQRLTSTDSIWSCLLLPHCCKSIITVVYVNPASFIFIPVDSSAKAMKYRDRSRNSMPMIIGKFSINYEMTTPNICHDVTTPMETQLYLS